MEEFAIDLRSPAVAAHTRVIERPQLSFRERVSAYVELTKPRITFLIVLTSAAGFAPGAGFVPVPCADAVSPATPANRMMADTTAMARFIRIFIAQFVDNH